MELLLLMLTLFSSLNSIADLELPNHEEDNLVTDNVQKLDYLKAIRIFLDEKGLNKYKDDPSWNFGSYFLLNKKG